MMMMIIPWRGRREGSVRRRETTLRRIAVPAAVRRRCDQPSPWQRPSHLQGTRWRCERPSRWLVFLEYAPESSSLSTPSPPASRLHLQTHLISGVCYTASKLRPMAVEMCLLFIIIIIIIIITSAESERSNVFTLLVCLLFVSLSLNKNYSKVVDRCSWNLVDEWGIGQGMD